MQMNIIYACDENYAPLTAISAASAAKHNRGAEITLLGQGLGAESVRLVQTAVERFGGAFRHVDVEDRLRRLSRAAQTHISRTPRTRASSRRTS